MLTSSYKTLKDLDPPSLKSTALAHIPNHEMNPVISIIIPTLNEEIGIERTLSELQPNIISNMGFSLEILVIDGGSEDKTREKAEKYGAKIIHEHEKGYGKAYKKGFQASNGDILVCLDGDSTYSLSVLSDLIQSLVQNDLDFISTNRLAWLEPEIITNLHKFGNLMLSFVVRFLFSINLQDSQSGMWVFRRKLLKSLNPISDGMAFSEELKIHAFTFYRSKEIPIKFRKRVGRPKINTISDGLKNLLHLFFLRLTINSK